MKKLFKSFTSVSMMLMMVMMLSTTTFAQETNMTSAELLAQNNNGIITLNEDITLSDSLEFDKDCTIDLNGHTLKFTQADNFIKNDANVTFENGTINLDGIQGKFDCILGVGNYVNSAKLTLDNVNLQANNYKSPYALIYVYGNSELNIKDSTLDVKNEKSLAGGVIKTSNGKNGKVNITDSTLNIKSAARGFLDGTINIVNSTVTMSGLANGINSNSNGLDLTVDNSELTITGSIKCGLTINDSQVDVKNNSKLNISKSLGGDIIFKTERATQGKNKVSTMPKLKVDTSSKLEAKKVEVDKSIIQYAEENDNIEINDLVNDLIESEIYDYTVGEDGNVTTVCDHLHTEVVNKEATCTEEGYTGDKVCTDCDKVLEVGTETLALGHNFENGTCTNTNCDELDPNFKLEGTVKPEENPSDKDEVTDEETDNTVKPEDTDKPSIDEETDNTVKPEDTQKPSTDNETDAPQTGDNGMYLMVAVAVLSATGLVYLRRKECR